MASPTDLGRGLAQLKPSMDHNGVDVRPTSRPFIFFSLTPPPQTVPMEALCSPPGTGPMSRSTRYVIVAFSSPQTLTSSVPQQLLQSHAVEIANQYTSSDAAAWKQAAANFRLPYWDWAANAVPPTQVSSDAKVTILAAPNATSTSVDNPILGYPFQPIDPSFPEPYSVWPRTLRHPTSEDASARSNPQAMISYV